jgi:hypothetical protein
VGTIARRGTSYQCYFAAEIRFPRRVQFQGDAASCGDAFEHREGMAGVGSIFQTRNHRLCRPDLLSELGLREACILPHLTDKERQVNLMQCAREGFAVGGALARARLDNFTVSHVRFCFPF